jgi:hypothetical protein
MTYRTLQDGRMLYERRATYAWWVLSERHLADELAAHGLSVDPAGPAEAGLYLVRGGPR